MDGIPENGVMWNLSAIGNESRGNLKVDKWPEHIHQMTAVL